MRWILEQLVPNILGAGVRACQAIFPLIHGYGRESECRGNGVSRMGLGHFIMENVEPGRVLLISRRPGRFAHVRRWLLYNHFSWLAESSLDRIVRMLNSGGSIHGLLQDYVFIDIDSDTDVDELFGQLFVIREFSPETRVILVCSSFKCDDFSSEGLNICDVSLRWPISLARLELGLVMSCSNNDIWREKRCVSLDNYGYSAEGYISSEVAAELLGSNRTRSQSVAGD